LLSRNLRRINPEDLDWRVLMTPHVLTKPIIVRLNLLALISELRSVVYEGRLTLPQEGLAVWGASLIHRVRSESIFNARNERGDKPRPNLIVPPIIEIPVKPGMLGATILEIVAALRRVLKTSVQTPVLDKVLQSTINLDDYLVKIEEELEGFLRLLEELLKSAEELPLRELFRGVDRLEAARRFILLLIAAGRGAVELYDDELTGGVYLKKGTDFGTD